MRRMAEGKARVARGLWHRSGQVLLPSETKPGKFNSYCYLPGRACRQGYPLGYRCCGLGLMFASIQAMNTMGLCHSGQTVMRPS
jgi:hypothetical protein